MGSMEPEFFVLMCNTELVTSDISSLWLLSGFQTCTGLLCCMQSPIAQFLRLLSQVKKALRL